MNEGISVIIPTYKEANTIASLLHRFSNISFANNLRYEVIIVDDDSNDGIIDIVTTLKQQFNWQWLEIIIRKDKPNSLGQSVLHGIMHAHHPIIIVMDADLSHPPETIPVMLSSLLKDGVDMVIGSRYVHGGSVDVDWPWSRKIASLCAAALARCVLGKNIRDPLSGYIAIRKDKILSALALQPIGWKISLEMMVKCRCQMIIEIPIHFSERKVGKSKMNVKVLVQYLLHIQRLAWYKFFKS